MENTGALSQTPPSSVAEAGDLSSRRGPEAINSTPKPIVLSRLPLVFQANNGQYEKNIRWFVQQSGSSIRFFDDKVEFHTLGANGKGDVLTLRWAGGLKPCQPQCDKELSAKGHFVSGGKQRRFTMAGAIRYPNIGPGIDLVFLINNGTLRYEINVSPEADLDAIVFKIDRATLKIDQAGNLIARTLIGELLQQAPRFLVAGSGKEQEEVSGSYRLLNERGCYGFHVQRAADDRRALLIDPELVFGAYVEDGSEPSPINSAEDIDLAVHKEVCDFAIRFYQNSDELYFFRLECSDPAQPSLLIMTIIRGVSFAWDIASAGHDGCYLLVRPILPSDIFDREDFRAVFTPPSGLAVALLDPNPSPHLLLRIGDGGALENYSFLNQEVRSLAVDPADAGGGLYVAGNIAPGAPDLENTDTRPSVPSVLLLKLKSDLSGVIWGRNVGGSDGPSTLGGKGYGIQITEVAKLGSGGQCHASKGYVAITGATRASDFPHSATFITGQSAPSPSSGTSAIERKMRAFVAMYRGSDGTRSWSAALPEDQFNESFGKTVAIAFDDGSCTWLLGQGNAENDRDTKNDVLYRLSADGTSIIYSNTFESWLYAHSRLRRDGNTRFDGDMIAHEFLAVERDGTCWLLGNTVVGGLASPDALDSTASSYSVSPFFRSLDAAGQPAYFSYIAGDLYTAPGRTGSQDLALEPRSGRLFGLVKTTPMLNVAIPTTTAAPVPFGDPYFNARFLFFIMETVPLQISLAKSCSVSTAQEGDGFTYTITLTNTGTRTVRNVTLRDQVSEHVVPQISGQWQQVDEQTVEIQGITVQAGTSQSWNLSATAFFEGSATNTISVIANDGTILATTTLEDAPIILAPPVIPLVQFVQSNASHVTFDIINPSNRQANNVRVEHRNLGSSAGLRDLDFISVDSRPEPGLGIAASIVPQTGSGGTFAAPQTRYIVEIASLPRGFVRVVASLPPGLKTARYGTELRLLDSAGAALGTPVTSTFNIGQIVTAQLELSLLSPDSTILGSSTPAPFDLRVELKRGATDPGNTLPALKLNVTFRVPAGTVIPGASNNPPPQLSLTPVSLISNNPSRMLRRITASLTYDVWLATFLIDQSSLAPQGSAIARVNLTAVLPAHNFQTYFIDAWVEGEVTNPPARRWWSP